MTTKRTCWTKRSTESTWAHACEGLEAIHTCSSILTRILATVIRHCCHVVVFVSLGLNTSTKWMKITTYKQSKRLQWILSKHSCKVHSGWVHSVAPAEVWFPKSLSTICCCCCWSVVYKSMNTHSMRKVGNERKWRKWRRKWMKRKHTAMKWTSSVMSWSTPRKRMCWHCNPSIFHQLRMIPTSNTHTEIHWMVS